MIYDFSLNHLVSKIKEYINNKIKSRNELSVNNTGIVNLYSYDDKENFLNLRVDEGEVSVQYNVNGIMNSRIYLANKNELSNINDFIKSEKSESKTVDTSISNLYIATADTAISFKNNLDNSEIINISYSSYLKTSYEGDIQVVISSNNLYSKNIKDVYLSVPDPFISDENSVNINKVEYPKIRIFQEQEIKNLVYNIVSVNIGSFTLSNNYAKFNLAINNSGAIINYGGTNSPTIYPPVELSSKQYVASLFNNLKNEITPQLDNLKTEFLLKDFKTIFETPLEIPNVTTDIANNKIKNIDITIEGEEAEQYAIAGLVKYEVKDESGNRLNCFQICSFSMNGQVTLRLRMMCAGSSSVLAKSINGALLLKRR